MAGEKSSHEEIEELLEETRVVIPGTQAMLGFQLVAIFSQAFTELPLEMKYTHVMSLVFVAASIYVLMSSAPYHRIAEKSRDTERVARYMRRAILTGMSLLSTGISFDVWLVVNLAVNSQIAAYIAAFTLSGLAWALWYILPTWRSISRGS